MALKQRDRGAKTPCKWCSRGGIYTAAPVRFTAAGNADRKPYVQTARLEIYGKSKDIVENFAVKDKKLRGFLKIDREWAENILYRYKRARKIEKLNKQKGE